MIHTVKQKILDIYDDFTMTEKVIADYLVQLDTASISPAKTIAKKLFVSEASLSRFAQKCGYRGFRELCYNFKNASNTQKLSSLDDISQSVASTYQLLLDRTLLLLDESKLHNIIKMISEATHIYFYGIGSSGIAANDFKTRLMRIGIKVEAIADTHLIRMNSAFTDSTCLVIGLSVSGETQEVISGLKHAKEHLAATILLTASKNSDLRLICDDILPIASSKNLNTGITISPQFPLLIMLDILYAYLLQTDYMGKISLHTETLSALYRDS